MTLTPPDYERCQAEKSNGAGPFSFGKHRMIRCTNKPLFVVTEKDPGKKDGLKGSMSLCACCLAKFNEQMPHRRIAITCIEEEPK